MNLYFSDNEKYTNYALSHKYIYMFCSQINNIMLSSQQFST